MYENNITSARYIGKTIDLVDRDIKHRESAKIRRKKDGKYKYNTPFANAIRKHGFENFTLIILEQGIPEKHLGQREITWIAAYNTYGNQKHYNITAGGEGTLGYKPTEKTLQRMRKAQSGKNNGAYGRVVSKETRRKKSESMKGKNNPNYGKPRSQETKEKISKALLGTKHSEETKEKHRGPNNKRYNSEIRKQRSIIYQDFINGLKIYKIAKKYKISIDLTRKLIKEEEKIIS